MGERVEQSDEPAGMSAGNVSIIGRCGRVKSATGGAPPGLVALGGIGKLEEQAMGSKPVCSTPPWSLLQLLPQFLSVVDCHLSAK